MLPSLGKDYKLSPGAFCADRSLLESASYNIYKAGSQVTDDLRERLTSSQSENTGTNVINILISVYELLQVKGSIVRSNTEILLSRLEYPSV